MVSSPYSLFCLIIDSSVYLFPYSSFFPALGSFSHPRLFRVTDGLEKWRRRESSQPVVKERDGREISISSKFAEVSFELVSVCLLGLSFLLLLLRMKIRRKKKKKKKVERSKNRKLANKLRCSRHALLVNIFLIWHHREFILSWIALWPTAHWMISRLLYRFLGLSMASEIALNVCILLLLCLCVKLFILWDLGCSWRWIWMWRCEINYFC